MSLDADVLVVDDHLLDAHATIVAFEQVAPRARVLHLRDGGEALEYLFSIGLFATRPPKMPQLIVLSLEMKTISGLCVLDLIRAHPLTANVPVVLTSLERGPRRYRRHDQFDANAYVTLPCDFQRYCAIIEGCTERWLPWARRPHRELRRSYKLQGRRQSRLGFAPSAHKHGHRTNRQLRHF